MPAATLQAMGLDHASMSASIRARSWWRPTPSAPPGPYAHRLGFDGLGQALSGAAYMSGEPGAPRRAAVNWVDFGTAISAAFGALLALMARERTGRGQEVSGSLMATALTFTNSVLIEQAINAPNRVPQGNLGYGSAPADLFECADGQWLIVQAVGQPLWQRFCKLLDAPRVARRPALRRRHRARPHAHVVSERLGAGARRGRVPMRSRRSRPHASRPGRCTSPQQALDDVHVRASGMLRDIAFPGASRPAPVADTPIRLSDTPGTIRGRAPLLGEHTEAILAEVGYSQADVARLRAAKVI